VHQDMIYDAIIGGAIY